MREIRSKDNRIFKECQKLSQKKYRDKEGLYLIEGENLIAEVPTKDLVYVFFREGRERQIFDLPDQYIVAEQLFDKLAQTETSQGILAVVRKPKLTAADLEQQIQPSDNVVVLDRLQDPGNIGTIIRTAEGAGYKAVVTVKGTGDVFSPKTIRAAAGSIFRMPVLQVEDNQVLRDLTDRLGKKLVVTGFHTDKYYYDEDLSRGVALVIGNEGNGVSDELMEMADITVKIPMDGHLESLNASVAAGILMYETKRKRD
ncbi:MAG: RNA methyltransferase [Firmicutes bacterium]|nr:RNA methyltransferase [Bacillota bacterium]